MLSLVESVASEPALMILRFKSMEFDISGSNFNAHICSYALREKFPDTEFFLVFIFVHLD